MRRDVDDVLFRPLRLPSGAVLANRVAKAAMSDGLGDGAGGATTAQERLYGRWADGGAGLALVGEVQVDARYPESPANLALESTGGTAALGAMTAAGRRRGGQFWAQLGHAGALADPTVARPRGPSTIAVGELRVEAMAAAEIAAVPERFAGAAAAAVASGFSGVQIHAAHGFLLSQFLSPLFNRRTDRWGGPLRRRAALLVAVVEAVRHAVGPAVPVGVKLNATDGLEGGLGEAEALQVIDLLEPAGLDLLEISGGAYVPGVRPASEGLNTAGAYFAEFAAAARRRTTTPLMLTGGIKTRAAAARLVAAGSVDVVGLARALVLAPDLPRAWASGGGGDPTFPRFATAPPGGVTAWYTRQLAAIARSGGLDPDLDVEAALAAAERHRARQATSWRHRFGAPAAT